MTDPNTVSARVAQLAEEFIDRQRRGERPSLAEYVGRHPELAGEIRQVFPAMAMIENLALNDASLTGDTPAIPFTPEARFCSDLATTGSSERLATAAWGSCTRPSRSRSAATWRSRSSAAPAPRPQPAPAFRAEARAAARLHHTNIVPVFGVGEHDGTPSYAMQFIAGPGP